MIALVSSGNVLLSLFLFHLFRRYIRSLESVDATSYQKQTLQTHALFSSGGPSFLISSSAAAFHFHRPARWYIDSVLWLARVYKCRCVDIMAVVPALAFVGIKVVAGILIFSVRSICRTKWYPWRPRWWTFATTNTLQIIQDLRLVSGFPSEPTSLFVLHLSATTFPHVKHLTGIIIYTFHMYFFHL
jgi:hypothetical protein